MRHHIALAGLILAALSARTAIAEPFSWSRMRLKPSMIEIPITAPERVWRVGDAFEKSGRVVFVKTNTRSGGGMGCYATVRLDDGNHVDVKIAGNEALPYRLMRFEGLKTHAATTPCHALTAAASSETRVTVNGRVTRLSATDTAGHSLAGMVAPEHIEIKAEGYAPADFVDTAFSGSSADGTFTGGSGRVTSVKTYRNHAELLCEATVANADGTFHTEVRTPDEFSDADFETSNAETIDAIRTVTAHSMLRTCDLLIDAATSGKPISTWGHKIHYGRIENPEITLEAAPRPSGGFSPYLF